MIMVPPPAPPTRSSARSKSTIVTKPVASPLLASITTKNSHPDLPPALRSSTRGHRRPLFPPRNTTKDEPPTTTSAVRSLRGSGFDSASAPAPVALRRPPRSAGITLEANNADSAAAKTRRGPPEKEVQLQSGPQPPINGVRKAHPGQRRLTAGSIRPGRREAQSSTAPDETRSLRSKAGGSRLKSDLATYFPNFDEIIAGGPKVPEFLKVNEPIFLVDEPLKSTTTNGQAKLPTRTPVKSIQDTATQSTPTSPPSITRRNSRPILPSLLPSSRSFEAIDLSSLAPIPQTTSTTDPLGDSHFLKAHQRSERREKQLRNIEKERAQHEKLQLEHLLDCLHGPDWLRVMGISGITDGARKEWEPKRDYFIREVKALLNKFRTWREAEKKLLLDSRSDRRSAGEDGSSAAGGASEDEEGEEGDSNSTSLMNGPDTSDEDAWAASQLLSEAKRAKRVARKKLAHGGRILAKPTKPPKPPKPFVSFFEKPHQRAAALGKARHGGRRAILAFGKPIPDVEEREFELPRDFITPGALLASGRKRRRMNREKKENE